MAVRGIRGATTCLPNPEAVLIATREMLQTILKANPTLETQEIAGAWFTVTKDLQVIYPARAARDLGWNQVPLMCALEVDVPNSLPHCVRILIQWNTELPQSEIRHVYLHDAVQLRPDLKYEN